jgi:erythromycin esterase-like protein
MLTLQRSLHEIRGDAADYDPLLEDIGNARYVLLGEASHGTHEFYRDRARITRLLIEQKGFNAVAVEADWPDAYRVNRFVKGTSTDESAEHALRDFQRFPQWMWRNTDVLNFVSWLRNHNQKIHSAPHRTGLYGIDLYSMFASIEAVLKYLDATDPEGAARARSRYECFDHFNDEAQQYGMLASLGLKEGCEEEVVYQLLELRRMASQNLHSADPADLDEHFFAEQNALVVSNAERYYRSMFSRAENSWNIRDRHMGQTLQLLMRHLGKQVPEPRIVVWAHNSHLGDARATDQSARGELNVGQLVRQANEPEAVRAIGFSTYDGTVTAATNWDEPAQHKRVRPGLPGSYEELLHQTNIPAFYTRTDADEFHQPRLQRAIGVIYRPETERQSHYYMADLPREFDWIIHFDRTRAVEPLEKGNTWHPTDEHEPPESYPTGL